MCGRFVIFSPYDIIKETFAIDTDDPGITPNYNVCPTMEIPAIIRENQKNTLVALHWGLVPFWARDRSMAARMINARVETVSQKPSFKNAFKHRRCLIPADGYYEWKGKKGAKQPYYIKLKSGAPIGFAGLWENWRDKADPDAPPLRSCTIITREAAPPVRALHDRMPVLLAPEHYQSWLNPTMKNPEPLLRMLHHESPREITYYPVSKAVNTVRNNTPAIIAPQDDPPVNGPVSE